MKRTTKFISALLLCLMLIPMFASCSDDGIPEGYQLIARDGDEFRLYVPTDWVDNTSSGITCAYYSVDADISVSVSVADDATADMSLDDYWSICNEKYTKELNGYALIADECSNTVLGGKDARIKVFTAKMTAYDENKGTNVEGDYKLMQVFAKNGEKMYIMTFIAPTNRYNDFKSIMLGSGDDEGIIKYFEFAEAYKSDESKKIPTNVKAPEGMKLASTDEHPYRLFIPSSWIIDMSTDAAVAYVSKTDSSNVTAQMYMTSKTSETVEDHWQRLKTRYDSLFSKCELISDEKQTVNGVPAHVYKFEVTNGGQDYIMIQAIYKKKNSEMIYTVTFTATKENFEKNDYEKNVEQIIENFEIR